MPAWRTLFYAIFVLSISACSDKHHSTSKTGAIITKYSVTFAAVKISDDDLTNNIGLHGTASLYPADRRKVLDYISGHPKNVSVYAQTGNIMPVVWANVQPAQIHMELDHERENEDFERFGMALTQFNPGMSVNQRDDGGLTCQPSCSWDVKLKQPIGGSTRIGMSGPRGGGAFVAGRPEIYPLWRGNGVSLWLLTTVTRR